MRRIFAGLVFSTFLATGAASASSFVTPEPMTAKLGPSMITLGEPAASGSMAKPAETIAKTLDETPLDYPPPGGHSTIAPAPDVNFVRVSASIIAMAEPQPAVSFEQVAAVDKEASDDEAGQREFFGPLPTVMRGGVVDYGGSAAVTVPVQPAKKPASRQTASSSRQPSPPPEVPIPSPTPAPPPAGVIPQAKIQ